MKRILKKIITNVSVKDEQENILLEQSNLFVETGRGFIRDLISGIVTLDDTKYVVEFGLSTQIPAESDTDLITPLDPTAYTNTYVITNVGDTEVDFEFTYSNGSFFPVSFGELGLFYRPLGPDPGLARVNAGVLLARLKSTFTTITIGSGKTVSITWKIIF